MIYSITSQLPAARLVISFPYKCIQGYSVLHMRLDIQQQRQQQADAMKPTPWPELPCLGCMVALDSTTREPASVSRIPLAAVGRPLLAYSLSPPIGTIEYHPALILLMLFRCYCDMQPDKDRFYIGGYHRCHSQR